jgi:hypothetical protein
MDIFIRNTCGLFASLLRTALTSLGSTGKTPVPVSMTGARLPLDYPAFHHYGQLSSFFRF